MDKNIILLNDLINEILKANNELTVADKKYLEEKIENLSDDNTRKYLLFFNFSSHNQNKNPETLDETAHFEKTDITNFHNVLTDVVFKTGLYPDKEKIYKTFLNLPELDNLLIRMFGNTSDKTNILTSNEFFLNKAEEKTSYYDFSKHGFAGSTAGNQIFVIFDAYEKMYLALGKQDTKNYYKIPFKFEWLYEAMYDMGIQIFNANIKIKDLEELNFCDKFQHLYVYWFFNKGNTNFTPFQLYKYFTDPTFKVKDLLTHYVTKEFIDIYSNFGTMNLKPINDKISQIKNDFFNSFNITEVEIKEGDKFNSQNMKTSDGSQRIDVVSKVKSFLYKRNGLLYEKAIVE